MEPGETVDLNLTPIQLDANRPTFLHFFNPACPCSRFNLDHLRSLIQSHQAQVRFIAVLQGDQPNLREAFGKLGLNMESVIDLNGAIARAAGVYATPQAVLINRQGQLYYRGNYNSSRYCTTKETEFARIAIESLRDGKPHQPIPLEARTAYGCPLPKKQVQKTATTS